MDVAELLHSVKIFAGLNKRQLARLAGRVARRAFPAGTQILRHGDTGVTLYLIISGRVAVAVQSDESVAERVLAELGPGEVFGEMALLDSEPRSANVTALEPTECFLLTRWDFEEEMGHDPEIARALLPVLSQRIRHLEDRILKHEPQASGA